MLPAGTTLVGDTYFGTHATASDLASRDIPFLFLTKRSAEGVTEGGELLDEGDVATGYIPDRKYYLHIYKNSKVGHKPARLVPMPSNCIFPQGSVIHSRGSNLPAPIGAYRHLAGGVDPANQMALHRFRTWSNAVRSVLLRYCMANMYVIARVSALVPEGTTMWQFRWELMEMLVPFAKEEKMCMSPFKPGQNGCVQYVAAEPILLVTRVGRLCIFRTILSHGTASEIVHPR